MIYLLAAAAILVVLASNAAAEEPLVCDPREQPEVCALKVQRNEALDAQAIAVGKWRRMEATAEAMKEYWRQYLAGLEAQQQQQQQQSAADAAVKASEASMKTSRAAEAAKGRAR